MKKHSITLYFAILYHPDYDRRFWNFTKSADLQNHLKRSRTITAGGESHPALRMINIWKWCKKESSGILV